MDITVIYVIVICVVGCLSQTQQPPNNGQCYQFVDLTQNYNLRSVAADYPRLNIAREYLLRTELKTVLGNLLSAVTQESMSPESTQNSSDSSNQKVNLAPDMMPLDPNYIPKSYAGAQYRRLNPYQKLVIPYQRLVPVNQNPYEHRVNIPTLPRDSRYLGGRGRFGSNPVRPYNRSPGNTYMYQQQGRGAGARNNSRRPSRPSYTPPAPEAPRPNKMMNNAASQNLPLNQKFTLEQLRKLSTPLKRPTQRYSRFNPYNSRSASYQYRPGHLIRKRSTRYTYKQLLQLVSTYNKPYPLYPGTKEYNKRYRYPNGYYPYANNYNPYTARSYTTLRTRLPIGSNFDRKYPNSQRYQYRQPHYRRKRSVRVEPGLNQQPVDPIGELCPAKTSDVAVFAANGADCYVIEPSRQMVNYASCGHDECKNCSPEGMQVNKCVENYHWVPIWSYCENLPENSRIREIELLLPKSCSCKTFQC